MENRSAIVAAVAAGCVVVAVVIAFSRTKPSAEGEEETSRGARVSRQGAVGDRPPESASSRRETRERRRESKSGHRTIQERSWDPLNGRPEARGDQRGWEESLRHDRPEAAVALPGEEAESPSVDAELLPEAVPTQITLSRVGAVPEEFAASANAWLGELINAANTADVSKLVEMIGLPEDAVPALVKYLEERANFELQVHDATIESRGGNRIQIKFTRVDTWVNPQSGEAMTESMPTEYNLYLDNGRWRFETAGS